MLSGMNSLVLNQLNLLLNNMTNIKVIEKRERQCNEGSDKENQENNAKINAGTKEVCKDNTKEVTNTNEVTNSKDVSKKITKEVSKESKEIAIEVLKQNLKQNPKETLKGTNNDTNKDTNKEKTKEQINYNNNSNLMLSYYNLAVQQEFLKRENDSKTSYLFCERIADNEKNINPDHESENPLFKILKNVSKL